MRKRGGGIRKVVGGGKIKETFEIREGEKGKEVVAHKVFDETDTYKEKDHARDRTASRN